MYAVHAAYNVNLYIRSGITDDMKYSLNSDNTFEVRASDSLEPVYRPDIIRHGCCSLVRCH